MKERKDKIRSEIGWISYYLRRKSRMELERKEPKPIVVLDEVTGDVCVSWTRTDDHGGPQESTV